jgi:flavin-dependent dehydrogenase
VIGAGPAGTTTAILLAERGHDVVVLDKARFPRPKACAEYVNPAAAGVLWRIGIYADALVSGAAPVGGMTVVTERSARFTLDYASGTPYHAFGLSRERLDWLLLNRARRAGADVQEGCHVRRIERDSSGELMVQVSQAGCQWLLRPQLLIGADGRHSVVAQALGVARRVRWPQRIGLAAQYQDFPLADDHGEMHVSSEGYCGIAPQEQERVNVAMVLNLTDFRTRPRNRQSIADDFASKLAGFPGLLGRVRQARRVSPVRGVGPLAHRVTQVAGDGYLLVGDAAGFFDPFTGEGIYDALRGGELVADAASRALRANDVSSTGFADYRRARRYTFAAKRRAAWLMQLFLAHPALLSYAAVRIARRPDVASVMSGVLGGYHDAAVVLSPRFLWQTLRP